MDYSIEISPKISSNKIEISIFSQLVSVFLKEKPKKLWKFKLVLFFSNMQLISLLLDNAYPNLITEQYRTGYIITIFYEFLNIYSYITIPKPDFISCFLLILMILYILLIVLFTLKLIYEIAIRKQKPTTLAQKIWYWLCRLHHSVIFQPINLMIIKTLFIDSYNSDASIFITDILGKIPVILILIFMSIINLGFAIFTSLFCHNILPNDISFSQKSGRYDFLVLIFKLLMGILINIESGSKIQAILYTLFKGLYLLPVVIKGAFDLLYYKECLNFYIVFFQSIIIDLIILQLIGSLALVFINNISTNTIECALFIGYCFIYYIINKYVKEKLNCSHMLSLNDIKNPNDLILLINLYKTISENGNPGINYNRDIKKKEIILQGIISSFIEIKYEIWPENSENLKIFENEISENSINNYDYNKLERLIIEGTLRWGLKKFPTNPLIRLVLIGYLSNDCEDYHAAILLLEELDYLCRKSLMLQNKDQEFSFLLEATLVSIKIDLETKLLQKYHFDDDFKLDAVQIKPDFISLLKYEEILEILTIKIHQQTENNMKFWENFLTLEPLMIDFYERANAAQSSHIEIENYWNKIISQKHFRVHPYLHLLYGLYELLVRNSENKARKSIKFYSKQSNFFQRKNDVIDNVFDPENTIISITLSKGKLGLVNSCSKNIEDQFGFTSFEVIGKNVSLLMSKIYQENHNSFLINLNENNPTNAMNNTRKVFAKHKEGYLRHILLHITYYPYIQEGLTIIGMLKPVKDYYEYIIINIDGTIDSATEEIGNSLNLFPYINERKVSIIDICEEFDVINKAFNHFLESPNQLENNSLLTASRITKIPSNQLNSLHFNRLTQTLSNELMEIHNQYKSIIEQYQNGSYLSFQEYTDHRSKNTALRNSSNLPINIKKRHSIKYSAMIYEEKYISISTIRIIRLSNSKSEMFSPADNLSHDELSKYPLNISGDKNCSLDSYNDDHSSLANKKKLTKKLKTNNSEKIDINAISRNNESYFADNFPFEIEDYNEKKMETKEIENINTLPYFTLIQNTNFNTIVDKPLISQNEHDYQIKTYNEEDKNSIYSLDKLHNLSAERIKEYKKLDFNFEKAIDHDNHQSLASISSSDFRIKAKIEEALDERTKFSFITLIRIAFLIFYLAAIITIIVSYNIEQQGLTEVGAQNAVLESGNHRAIFLTQIARCSWISSFISTGLMDNNRHEDVGIPDYQIKLIPLLQEFYDQLKNFNNILLNVLWKLDSQFQYQIYSFEVQIKNTDHEDTNVDNKIFVNSFDGINEVLSNVNSMMKTSDPITHYENVHFILENASDTLLLAVENSVAILITHLILVISLIIQYKLILLITMGGAFFIIFFASLYHVNNQNIERRNFIQIFLRINDKDAEIAFKRLKEFNNLIKSNHKDRDISKLLKVYENYENYTVKHSKIVKKQKFIKIGKETRLKRNIYIKLFFLLVVFCIYQLGFMADYIYTQSYCEQQQIFSLRMVYLDVTFYHYVLGFVTTYIYIAQNGNFSIEGVPLNSIIDSYLDRISSPADFYLQFQDAPGYIPPEIDELLKTDLCIKVFSDPQDIDICHQSGDGAPQNGLISVMSWIGRTLRTMKNTYDISNKTEDAIKDIFNQTYVKNLEMIFDNVFFWGFEALNSRVNDDISGQQALINLGIILRTVFGAMIYATLPLFIGNWVFKYLDNLPNDFKKVMKMIPISILRNNTSMKVFLLKISSKILGPIKNKI